MALFDNSKGYATPPRAAIADWRAYFKDNKEAWLYQYLFQTANHTQGQINGITIDRGQLLTSQNALVEHTGLTRQEIRTRLARLQSSGKISQDTNQAINQGYTIITICEYDNCIEYNKNPNQASNHKPTKHQPSINQASTTNNNKKNKNNEINVMNERVFTPPTLDDIKNFHLNDKYFDGIGYNEDAADHFWNYYESIGWKNIVKWEPAYKNWIGRILRGEFES